MVFDIEEWLEQVAKLDELIIGKLAERDRLMALATNVTAKPMDGMPYSNTGITSRKVENAVVELTMLSDDIDALIRKFKCLKKEVIETIEKLPCNEYAILHRRYIRYMTWEEIAEDMGFCTVQVWRIKKKAIKNLKDVMKCNEM